jgi:hypothetical protein
MSLPAMLLALAAAASTAAPPTESKDVPIPEKVPSPPSSEVAPTVNIRTMDNGDIVEEYRTAGQLTMIHVRPAHGKPYYLYADNKGRLDRSEAERNSPSPVYWVIYSWK